MEGNISQFNGIAQGADGGGRPHPVFDARGVASSSCFRLFRRGFSFPGAEPGTMPPVSAYRWAAKSGQPPRRGKEAHTACGRASAGEKSKMDPPPRTDWAADPLYRNRKSRIRRIRRVKDAFPAAREAVRFRSAQGTGRGAKHFRTDSFFSHSLCSSRTAPDGDPSHGMCPPRAAGRSVPGDSSPAR